jgi:hypothetical protein
MTSKENPAVQALIEVTNLNDLSRIRLEKGAGSRVYGPFVERMALHAVTKIESGALDPQPAVKALEIASALYLSSDKRYSQNPHAIRGDALKRHQANVLGGDIVLVPKEAATAPEEGIAQVVFANDMLRAVNSKVEAALSDINYGSLFRMQTMAGATRTLDRREIDDLLESMSTSQEAMPHLSVSNWAIGQTVAGIYEYLGRSQVGRLRIIDIGSGHGATTAAETNSIVHVDGIDRRPEIAITALETTTEFYKELATFAENDHAASALDLERVRLNKGSDESISTFGTLTTVNDDAVEVMKKADMSEWADENDITVVTANYSFHRLPQSSKDAILERFSHLPNVVFIVGDLAQNTSVINRRYFNLAANGPLNPGNRNLTKRFGKFGYDLVDLEKQKPMSLDQRLAKRLSDDHRNNDGHLWIAYKGAVAAEALQLQSATK